MHEAVFPEHRTGQPFARDTGLKEIESAWARDQVVGGTLVIINFIEVIISLLWRNIVQIVNIVRVFSWLYSTNVRVFFAKWTFEIWKNAGLNLFCLKKKIK